MKTFAYSLLFSMICFHCTSVILIKYDQSTYAELNEELDSEDVTIIKTNQEVIKGYDIKLSQDSTMWRDSQQNKIFDPTREIKEIIFESAWDGAEDGFTYGFLIGAGVGILGVLGNTDDGDKSYSSPGLATALIGIGWGLGFGLIGLPVGAAIGHTDKYIFQMP
jgi:hypothetical protein